MPVYMIIDIEAKDPGTYAEFMEKVPATVVQYGGRYLVRGGAPTSLAGSDLTVPRVALEERIFGAIRDRILVPEHVAYVVERAMGVVEERLQGRTPAPDAERRRVRAGAGTSPRSLPSSRPSVRRSRVLQQPARPSVSTARRCVRSSTRGSSRCARPSSARPSSRGRASVRCSLGGG